MQPEQTAGLILAGGKSHRMGQDKSHLELSGQSLLERSKQMLYAAGCREVIVSSDNLEGAVRDRYSNIGPIAGIEAGMAHLLSQNFHGVMLILPVDMPLLTTASLQQLITAMADHELARFENNPLPLCVELSSQSYEQTKSLAIQAKAKGGIPIKSMFDTLKSTTIEPTSKQLSEFFNCNNPLEFTQLQNSLT